MDESTEIFKASVKEFVDIHNQLLEAAKSLKEVRKKKNELAEVILDFMTKNNYEVAASGDFKLVKRDSKRQGSLKDEYILAAVKELYGDVDANKLIENISARREIVVKSALSCRLQKK